ncbi:MAG: GNAT family N-acetyltransferase [Acidimicrobiia bacterium]
MLPTPPEGLRHWRPEDAPALAAAWADPAITRWNPPPPDLDAAAWIAGVEERWARRLALDLVIEPWAERADRRAASTEWKERTDRRAGVAGEVGLSGFTTDPARAELGVWVAAEHRRSGLASAAVDAVTRWALTDLGLDQLWARTDRANGPAKALFARLGWQRLGESGGRSIWSATRALLR